MLQSAHQKHPDVVVAARSRADIAVAVRIAAEHRIPISMQATGDGAHHAFAGGMLISTKRLAEVQIDAEARTAAVGPGATWDIVLGATAPSVTRSEEA